MSKPKPKQIGLYCEGCGELYEECECCLYCGSNCAEECDCEEVEDAWEESKTTS